MSVKDFQRISTWSFRNDVLPVMTKMGCNSGPCHGAAAGKNGFKLTLRGYDPEVDYYTLTHQALARRTEAMEPAKSLILLKPTLDHSARRRKALCCRLARVQGDFGLARPGNAGAAGILTRVLPKSRCFPARPRCALAPNSNCW